MILRVLMKVRQDLAKVIAIILAGRVVVNPTLTKGTILEASPRG